MKCSSGRKSLQGKCEFFLKYWIEDEEEVFWMKIFVNDCICLWNEDGIKNDYVKEIKILVVKCFIINYW